MTRSSLLLVLLVASGSGFTAADALFQNRQFREAASVYRQLQSDYPTLARPLMFNQAQALWAQDSLSEAARLYGLALPGLAAAQKSSALNNLALQQLRANSRDQALQLFREALLADPTNEIARRNFEILKRRLLAEPPPPYEPPPPPMNPPNRPDPPPPSESLGAQREQQPLPSAEAQAALRKLAERRELYLQQLRRRAADPPRFTDQPDW